MQVREAKSKSDLRNHKHCHLEPDERQQTTNEKPFLCFMNLSHLERMRIYFETHAPFDHQFRKKQLIKLREGILSHEQELYEAFHKDLKRSPEEVWVTETGFVIAEINHALRHLKQWMKPKRTRTNLLNFPSRSFVYKEPLGVVLVAGPWNYPLQLLFTPLVGAMAAGKCVVVKPSEVAPA